MSPKPALELAARDDAPVIARLSRDRIESGLGWSWTTPRVLRAIVDADTNVVVARRSGRTLGFGIMKYRDDEAHLLLLAVRADATRQGLGTQLVEWLEEAARVAGAGQIYLEARLSSAVAQAFYRVRGYREIQQVPHYYEGREACVRMAKDLWLEQWETG